MLRIKNCVLENVGLGRLERKRGGERMEKIFFLPNFQQLYVILCFFPYKRLVVQFLPDLFYNSYQKINSNKMGKMRIIKKRKKLDVYFS